jgi:4a-hydroxytetrahydrobiopterin dehydratase
MNLSKKSCTPCRGGIPPLTGEPLTELQGQLDPNWRVINEHHLEKEYLFKNFQEALAFVNKIGEIAEQEGHHPDIHLSYGKVKIQLWTHKIDGLSENDFIVAAKCDLIPQSGQRPIRIRLRKTALHINQSIFLMQKNHSKYYLSSFFHIFGVFCYSPSFFLYICCVF